MWCFTAHAIAITEISAIKTLQSFCYPLSFWGRWGSCAYDVVVGGYYVGRIGCLVAIDICTGEVDARVFSTGNVIVDGHHVGRVDNAIVVDIALVGVILQRAKFAMILTCLVCLPCHGRHIECGEATGGEHI